MKKRVKEGKLWSLFLLLIILVVISLVVDLLSLNVLYGLGKDGGLKGELASLTEEYCDNLANEALAECLEDIEPIVVRSYYAPNFIGGYSYIDPEDRRACEQVERNARSACMALVSEPDDDYFKY